MAFCSSQQRLIYSALLNFHTFYYAVVVLGIPLYELAIYPLARNWIPSALKRVGIGAFGTIIVASVALSVDMVVHAHTNVTVECMFVENRTTSSVVDSNYFWVDIPLGINCCWNSSSNYLYFTI